MMLVSIEEIGILLYNRIKATTRRKNTENADNIRETTFEKRDIQGGRRKKF